MNSLTPVPSPNERGEVKELPLKNYNNCLSCDAFNYITFAPARPITDEDLEKIYLVKNGDEIFYCKIVDLYRCKFSRMPTIATFPAFGMEGYEWQIWWLEQYPQTTDDTEMVVYQYKKIKE